MLGDGLEGFVEVPGVVDEDVHGLRDLGDGGLDGLGVGDVAAGDDLDALERVEPSEDPRPMHDDVRAAVDELLDEREADAAVAARDEDALPLRKEPS